MDSVNQQFVYALIIIAIGYALKRFHIFKKQDGEALARIVFNLTLPSLIISTFHEAQIEGSLLLLTVIGIAYGFFSAFLGIFVFRHQPKQIKGMLAMMMPGLNIGLFAYPLVEGIWSKEGIKYFGMLDVGNAFIAFGLCYFVGNYYSSKDVSFDFISISKKMMKSIPFVTYIMVCSCNLLGVALPSFLTETSKMISFAHMPMALLLLGCYLHFTFDRNHIMLAMKFLSLRYGTGILMGLILFFTLPFGDMFRYTVLIGLLLPTSISALPFSIEFDYNQKFVGTVSNLSMLLSFVLLWLVGNI